MGRHANRGYCPRRRYILEGKKAQPLNRWEGYLPDAYPGWGSLKAGAENDISIPERTLWLAVLERALCDWYRWKTWTDKPRRSHNELGLDGRKIRGEVTPEAISASLSRLLKELHTFFYASEPHTLQWIAEQVAPDPAGFCEQIRRRL